MSFCNHHLSSIYIFPFGLVEDKQGSSLGEFDVSISYMPLYSISPSLCANSELVRVYLAMILAVLLCCCSCVDFVGNNRFYARLELKSDRMRII